jgi:hypothetical protein
MVRRQLEVSPLAHIPGPREGREVVPGAVVVLGRPPSAALAFSSIIQKYGPFSSASGIVSPPTNASSFPAALRNPITSPRFRSTAFTLTGFPPAPANV